jgi:hypothetical protein
MIETAHSTAPDEARLDAAEAAAHLAVSTHLIGTGDPELAAFFTSFARYASPEDLIHYTGAELAALVKLVFARTARRAPGTRFLHCRNSHPGFSHRCRLSPGHCHSPRRGGYTKRKRTGA